MKAISIDAPGKVALREIPEPLVEPGDLLLQVEVVGLCGTDLNSFRGKNLWLSFLE